MYSDCFVLKAGARLQRTKGCPSCGSHTIVSLFLLIKSLIAPLVSFVTPFTCFGGTGVVPSCSVNETVVYLPYMHLDYIGDSVTVQCLHGF